MIFAWQDVDQYVRVEGLYRKAEMVTSNRLIDIVGIRDHLDNPAKVNATRK
jgi:hypothetical protein